MEKQPLIDCPVENYLYEKFCLSIVFWDDMCFENTMWFHLECKSNCLSLSLSFLLTPRDTKPADVTRMVAGSINPQDYKSMWYTVYSTVLKRLSLIYVIGNLSNTILLNYVCFPPWETDWLWVVMIPKKLLFFFLSSLKQKIWTCFYLYGPLTENRRAEVEKLR